MAFQRISVIPSMDLAITHAQNGALYITQKHTIWWTVDDMSKTLDHRQHATTVRKITS